jgi:RNA polymerase sigma-70 factor (ECF subfamily)
MNDSEIIELFWQRAEDALTVCEQEFSNYCRRIIHNILENNADTEECLNDTWLKAWNAIPPAKPTRLKAFLGKISRNLALDRYEKAHAQKRGSGAIEIALEELAELGEIQAIRTEGMDEGEITEVINGFLRAEPIENADIFVKRYWYLQSIKSISKEYGYSESKVKSLLLRMRKRLKNILESEDLM